MQNLRTIIQNNYKIAIVKFCLQIARNCNQSCTTFQFFKVYSSKFVYCNPTGGRRPPAGPTGHQGAQRAPSPPQELEGWARANFQFSRFKVQGLEIATLLGAKGPQKGLGARRAPQPSAGARRMGAQRPDLLVSLYCNK